MITSIKNPMIKHVRELLAHKKHRDQAQAFVVEGIRLAEEALAAGFTPKLALHSAHISDRGKEILATLDSIQTQVEELDAHLLDRVSATDTSQGLLMVFDLPAARLEDAGEPVLVLDQMRDPGNMGTILRSAAAFGLHTVILTPGCTDPFSPKVLRAGMGAQFKLCLQNMSAGDIHAFCKAIPANGLNILLADSLGGKTCWESNLSQPLCLIIGGEAFGAEPEIRNITDGSIFIPMQANNESLNAAMAASILMYEIYRQRKAT